MAGYTLKHKLLFIENVDSLYLVKMKRRDREVVGQGSQTRGPPDAFVRPANIPKDDKIIVVDQILLILRSFLVNCRQQKLIFLKMRPEELFFFGMWPSDKFEFETPVVGCVAVGWDVDKWI